MATTIPYEHATTGKARNETIKLLQLFGCESVGFVDDFDHHMVVLAFRHRGRAVRLEASAKGWAELWLKRHPYNRRSPGAKSDHEKRALSKGLVAVNCMLRDWVKGQVTAVECGMLSFEAVFLPYMLTSDGRRIVDTIDEVKLLPPPRERVR